MLQLFYCMFVLFHIHICHYFINKYYILCLVLFTLMNTLRFRFTYFVVINRTCMCSVQMSSYEILRCHRIFERLTLQFSERFVIESKKVYQKKNGLHLVFILFLWCSCFLLYEVIVIVFINFDDISYNWMILLIVFFILLIYFHNFECIVFVCIFN